MKNNSYKNRTDIFIKSLWKAILLFSIVVCTIFSAKYFGKIEAQTIAPYKNPSLSIDERTKDLLSRMTLEEKVAQLMGLWKDKPQAAETKNLNGETFGGRFSAEKAKNSMPFGIGQIARQKENTDARASAEFSNDTQKWLLEHTRLGIPAIFHDEILHGNMARGSTVFPTPISMASSWDTELISKVFTVGALETRVRGSHHVLGPNLDLARDARWGRTEETFGEDPYLTSVFAVAAVKALQGGATNQNPKIDKNNVIATGKHFVGHGQPEGGTNIAPVNLSERLLRETHLKTFEAAIKEGGLQSIMPAYHEIDGIPVHANKYFLQNILREEFGFQGVVVSDYNAIRELESRHHVALNKADSAKQALEAGVDIELPNPDNYLTLVEQVKSGKISERTLNTSVARVLRSKFQLGLFENPYVDVNEAVKTVNSKEHRALALEAAQRSIILLKNEDNLLPLDKTKLKSIAIIGPNAAKAHLGGYTDPKPPKTVSILEGIQNKLGNRVKVNYAKGVIITKEGGDWFGNTSTLNDEESDRKLIAEAVKTAQNSDAVILAIGGNEDTNKEAWADNHLGDRDSLELVGRQSELVKSILAVGKPTVVFLTNSGPLAIGYVAENVPAILEGFYLGEETGNAVADVIFGDINPSGKLPVTFPRSVGQLPHYYNQKPTAKRGYLYTSTKPLFNFGYGLSYTTFKYSDLKIENKQILSDGETVVSINVTNTGKRRGDEIVQMYLRDEVSSVTRPVKELRDFIRISLESGETKKVTFKITPDKLWFYNREMKRVVEPGTFQVMVGGNSVELITEKFEVVEK